MLMLMGSMKDAITIRISLGRSESVMLGGFLFDTGIC